MTGSHYDTLGVHRDASAADIKKAFLQLSKATHPDVGGPTANAERFKQISVAASILTNKRKRAEYDRELFDFAGPYGNTGSDLHRGSSGFHRAAEFRRPRHHQRSSMGLHAFFGNIMRPRTFVVGAVSVFTVACVSSTFAGGARQDDDADTVQAWKNPDTGHWETPAPWDPTYQKLNPELVSVPRQQVQHRRR